MHADLVQVEIRRRSAWESIDLGVAMARAWAGPLLRRTAPLYLSTAILLLAVVPAPGLAYLVLWWLRPLFERLPLSVASRTFFGAPPMRGRELLRFLTRGAIEVLTVRRLSFRRSFLLPVLLLEGTSGGERRARERVIGARFGREAVWLTSTSSILEFGLATALVSLVLFLSPRAWFEGFEEFVEAPTRTGAHLPDSVAWLLVCATILASLFTEILYAVAGFSLYVQRRIELEGWDVELSFRGIGDRFGKLLRPQAGHSSVVSVLFAISFLFAGSAAAGAITPLAPRHEGEGAEQQGARDPQGVMEEILASPDFSTVEMRKTWGPRDSGSAGSGPLAGLLETPIRVLAALVVLAGIGFLLVQVLRALAARSPSPGSSRPRLEELHGLDVRPESLPDDVGAEAWSLWTRGDRRAALGLLYRGALAHLVHVRELPIERGDTEGDCLRRLSGLAEPDLSLAFGSLTSAWQATAYAGATLPDERVRVLCQDFGRHFGVRR